MRFPQFLITTVLICLIAPLFGQMTPNAPIKNFRLPRFADSGYTEWVLQGEKGIYDSDEQVRVEMMMMRVYSGDDRMALELSMESPEALLRLKENRAYSDAAIKIVGANFEISGLGWEWSGKTKEIIVKNDTLVRFTQGIGGGFIGTETPGTETPKTAAPRETEIRSEGLVLRTTEKAYYFEFTGQVHAISDEMDLKSEQLIAFADPPKGREDKASKMAPGELNSIRQIIARDEVIIVFDNKTVKADEAEFFPREQRSKLSGSSSLKTKGIYISGETIRSQSGKMVILGTEAKGRAQMILTKTGGLGIEGASALTSDTIILADTITMREQKIENHFIFEGNVEVMSGALQMRSAVMRVVANKSKKPAEKSKQPAEKKNEAELEMGEVKEIVADGGVRIERNGQIATGEKVTFYPADGRAVLTGDPRVTNGEAVVTGQTMVLKPKLAIIRGEVDDPVTVSLPEMPDLGYEASGPTDRGVEQKPAVQVKPQATVVTSQLLHMVEEPKQTVFRFTENVTVTASNLHATCARMNVITREPPKADSKTDPKVDPKADPGAEAPLKLERIEAYDDVVIQQTGRTATAQKAIIMPKEGKVILEGQAVVDQERGRVAGHRMILLRGERRAIVEGGGPEGERARITLPATPKKD